MTMLINLSLSIKTMTTTLFRAGEKDGQFSRFCKQHNNNTLCLVARLSYLKYIDNASLVRSAKQNSNSKQKGTKMHY